MAARSRDRFYSSVISSPFRRLLESGELTRRGSFAFIQGTHEKHVGTPSPRIDDVMEYVQVKVC
jgi:hypothetical protein